MNVLRMKGSYRKKLVIVLLITSFPGIIFNFLLIFISKHQMEEELQRLHQAHLADNIRLIQEQFTDLERLAANWAYEANKTDYRNIDTVMDYAKLRELYQRLAFMANYNPMVGNVELFINDANPRVYSETGYLFLEDEEQQTPYNQLLHSKKYLFWDDKVKSINQSVMVKHSPLVLVYNLDNYTNIPYGSLLVFMEEERIQHMLQSPYKEGSAFLVRNREKWLFGEKNITEPSSLQQEIMEYILANDQQDMPKAFIHRDSKIEYTVSYDVFNRLGEEWYYVSVASMTNITSPVVFISKTFLVLNVIVLTGAMVLALFASSNLYRPIEKLTNRIREKEHGHSNEFNLIETHLENLLSTSEELQTQIETQLPQLRSGFILQLVQGYLSSYNEKQLQEKIVQLGFDYIDKKYIIIYVQLSGFQRMMNRYSEGDESLVTFVAVNIAEELSNTSHFEADVINFHDLSFGILLSFDKVLSDDEIEPKVHQFGESLIQYINSICKMNVSVGISRIANSLKLVHRTFEELKLALSLRNAQEVNQLIEMSKLDGLFQGVNNYEYPFDLEKELIQAIRSKDQERAALLTHDFFAFLTENEMNEATIKQIAFKLLGSIFHIVLQTGINEEFSKAGESLYERLYKLKDPEEISYWFEHKVVQPIIEEMSNSQDRKYRLIVQSLISKVDSNYMEDISLEEWAREANLYPSFLSKIFKDISGWNFIDYLTHVRLTKAKELLKDTDVKIKDIAESVGYNQQSYFNRMFKKEFGLTPGEYREQYRN